MVALVALVHHRTTFKDTLGWMKWCKLTVKYVTGSYTVEPLKGVGECKKAPLPGGEQVAFDSGAMFGSHSKDMCG